MSRVSMFNSPLLLGFDQMERTLDRLAKNAEGYPPYNIEQIGGNDLRIAVAQVQHPNTADKIDIALVVGIPHFGVFAVGQGQGMHMRNGLADVFAAHDR